MKEFYLKKFYTEKKLGFNVPIKEWALDTIVGYTEDNLKSFTANYGFFDYDVMLDKIRQTKSGNTEHINKLWTVYFFMNWFNRWA